MRDTQKITQRLLEGLIEERECLAQRRRRMEDAQRKLADLEKQLRAGDSELPAVIDGLLAGLGESVEQLRASVVEGPARRLHQRTQALEELSGELSRMLSLAWLGELSASVAHEIRNPLCGILLSAEVLQTKMDPDDSRNGLLANLRREAEKMEKVVNNLLHFARSYNPRLELCNLEDAVQNTVESVHWNLEKKRMQVRIRALPGCEAEVGPDLVQQVFRNILLNSVDASPEGSTLDVELWLDRELDCVAVAFRDPGEGIPPEIQGKIFAPFFTSKHNGLGLGLAVSKRIMDAHDGRIEVESEPGKGTTFTVLFPRRSAQRQEKVAACAAG